jgi:hypothetical protein
VECCSNGKADVIMQAIIYCQIQNNLPECIWASLKKTREMYDGDIYLIAPQREHDYQILSDLNIKMIAREKLKSPLISEYERHTFFPALYPEWDGFWDNVCKRFVYLSTLMEQQGIDEIFHIENDIAVYLNIRNMFEACKNQYGGKIVFSPHEMYHLNCGLTYCGSVETMRVFCQSIIEYFKRGEKWFREKYPSEPILNETLFTYTFHVEHSDKVGLFPTMPDDQSFKNLGFLVDPDGWGRWVDGVRYAPGKPYAAPRYYIGNEILNGRYDVHFSFENGKIKMPWVYDKTNNQSFPLATLHFNSKRVEKWL